jgi:DUF2950 family protein
MSAMTMHPLAEAMRRLGYCFGLVSILLLAPAPAAAQGAPPATPPAPKPRAAPKTVPQKSFATPEDAAWALIVAAEQYDVPALTEILGPDGVALVVTQDSVMDRNQATAFAAMAREETHVVRDARKGMATVNVGPDDWPLPIPIVLLNGRWRFDSKAGRQEILYRRIGRNELDAIQVCRGYVEAQRTYAYEKHDGELLNQYAQRIVSTPGKHDGLAWMNPDSSWGGPVGEGIARAIAEGYSSRNQPYHGYYFKILKGQGPAAPMGQLDFVVKGAMIGGFALVAAPAEYSVTGVKTFIVSHDGVVYQKDYGTQTLQRFSAMTRYNPDATWEPVEGDDDTP